MGRPQAIHNTGQDKWKFVTGDKSDLIIDRSWTIAEHTNMSKTGSGGDSCCECLYFLVYSLAVLHAVERRYSVYFCKASGCIFYSLSYKFWHSICKNYIWCVRVWHFKLCSEDAMRKTAFLWQLHSASCRVSSKSYQLSLSLSFTYSGQNVASLEVSIMNTSAVLLRIPKIWRNQLVKKDFISL